MTYDPRLVTQAEAELLRNIADNIVQPDVMDRMDEINWTSAQPRTTPTETVDNPPSDGSTTTEPPKTETAPVDNPPAVTTPPNAKVETVPVTSEPDIDWESYRGKNGLILEKYKNKEEAIKGVRHAVQMAKEALTQKEMIEVENLRLRNELISRQTLSVQAPQLGLPETKPASSLPLDEVLSKIVADGGTLDEQDIPALRDSITEYAKSTAQNAVSEALKIRDDRLAKEQKTWQDVDAYMREKHPAALDFVDEIDVFIRTNPLINKAVNALINSNDHREAAELAWTEFDRARNAVIQANQTATNQVKEIQLDAADKVRQDAVDQARQDAGVFATVAGGVHETVKVGPTQEDIDAAAARMRNTGLGDEWRRLTIGRDLDNDPMSRTVFGP